MGINQFYIPICVSLFGANTISYFGRGKVRLMTIATHLAIHCKLVSSLSTHETLYFIVVNIFKNLGIAFAEIQPDHKSHVPYGWIFGGVGIVLGIILLLVTAFVLLRSFSERGDSEKDQQGKVPHKFHILKNPSIFCGSGRYICCNKGDWKQTNAESSNRQGDIPKG